MADNYYPPFIINMVLRKLFLFWLHVGINILHIVKLL